MFRAAAFGRRRGALKGEQSTQVDPRVWSVGSASCTRLGRATGLMFLQGPDICAVVQRKKPWVGWSYEVHKHASPWAADAFYLGITSWQNAFAFALSGQNPPLILRAPTHTSNEQTESFKFGVSDIVARPWPSRRPTSESS